jgi:hypothetical protein
MTMGERPHCRSVQRVRTGSMPSGSCRLRNVLALLFFFDAGLQARTFSSASALLQTPFFVFVFDLFFFSWLLVCSQDICFCFIRSSTFAKTSLGNMSTSDEVYM